MKSIFSNSFYSQFTPPNKEEIFKALKTAKVDKNESEKIKWNKNCKVEVEILYKDEIGKLFIPSLDIFLEGIGVDVKLPFQFRGIWKNTYRKGGYQEIHDHLAGEYETKVPFYGLDEADLAGCFFLEDSHQDAGKFYFYNRHSSELNVVWTKFMKISPDFNGVDVWYPNYKAGDIILFPAYMLHGVTPHGLNSPRTTVSFNIKFFR